VPFAHSVPSVATAKLRVATAVTSARQLTLRAPSRAVVDATGAARATADNTSVLAHPHAVLYGRQISVTKQATYIYIYIYMYTYI